MDLRETKALLDRYGLKPSKSLGQNFLVTERFQEAILELAEIKASSCVLEVGPGLGCLTEGILKAQPACFVAVEKDLAMCRVLRDKLPERPDFHLIHADALKLNLADLFPQDCEDLLVLANLPYYVTSKLFRKLLLELPHCRRLVLMMQTEAGERLFAQVGDRGYGPNAILASLFGELGQVIKVPAQSFYPRPKVGSSIYCLTRGDKLQTPDSIEGFSAFLQACFGQKRKTLANNLQHSWPAIDLTDLVQAYQLSRRPDQVSLAEYLSLYQEVRERGGFDDC